ncbi:MAG: diaminopimelate decarboxylase, partial [Aggregatilineales bacterium]
PENIVFAGVGKTIDEITYAIEKGVGWFNVENVMELTYINEAAQTAGQIQVALRLNPQVTADTHPYIATGHGGAKFGLTADVIRDILSRQNDYPCIKFSGIHIHIGSQLGETSATREAAERVIELITPCPDIRTINIGGGMPARYDADSDLPVFDDFSTTLHPVLKDYHVILEPGRSIIADAGILLTKILYVKEQAGQLMYIVDASMTELMRPMLYQAKHEIIPVHQTDAETQAVQIVGPVCETTDVLAKNIQLPRMQVGDLLAILTTGAYGMVMASNYNARPYPAEIVVNKTGDDWHIARKRQTWDDLLKPEIL